MLAPKSYNLQMNDLFQENALDKLRLIINSDYFGQYELGSSKIVFDRLKVESGGVGIRGEGRKRVKVFSKTLSDIISHVTMSEANFQEAMLTLYTPEEIKRRLGVIEREEDEPEFPLDIVVRDIRNGTYFSVFNLGLKRSFYEEMGLMKLYIQDRRGLCKWYREVDAELKALSVK